MEKLELTKSELIELARIATFHLDDRLVPYSREDLRAMAWIEGLYFEYRRNVCNSYIASGIKPEHLSTISNLLLSVSRKQVASEIDADVMTEKYRASHWYIDPNFSLPIYRQGIEDTLKAIKGE